MYEYKAIVTNVVDGDTIDVNLDAGFHVHIYARLRFLGIDTPESRGEAEKEYGKICGKYAEKLLLGKEIIINTDRQDSFGRWLSYIWVDGKDIIDIYNDLGINKLNTSTYSLDKIKELEKTL